MLKKKIQTENWLLDLAILRSLLILTRAVLENDGYESLIGASSREKGKKTETVKTTLQRTCAAERSRETKQ